MLHAAVSSMPGRWPLHPMRTLQRLAKNAVILNVPVSPTPLPATLILGQSSHMHFSNNPTCPHSHLDALLVHDLDVAADASVLVHDAVLDHRVGTHAQGHAAVGQHFLALLFTLVVVGTDDQGVLQTTTRSDMLIMQ